MAALALETTFPEPLAADHDDVRCALTVASASWRRGNVDDARKWLRRAAKAAADSDDVMRAVALSKAVAELGPTNDADDRSDERPAPLTAGPPPLPPVIPSAPSGSGSARPLSSGPPPRRSGFAPKRERRSAAPPARTDVPRLQAPPPIPSAAATVPRRRVGSDLETTRRRMPCVPAIPPPPPPAFDLPRLLDDDEEEPTAIRTAGPPSPNEPRPNEPRPNEPRPNEPRPSEPIALAARVPERSGSYPSRPGLEESLSEDTIRDRGRLHPPVRDTDDAGIPLSAARVAVVACPHGGKPDIFFLPFGAVAPPGAVTAMLVTTNARDAAQLAELMTAATR